MSRPKIKHGLAVFLVLVVVGLTACPTAKISSTPAVGASFDEYKTFAILQSKSINDEEIRDLVEMMIAAELEGKGLEEVNGNADLLVTCDGWLSGHEQIASSLGYAVETYNGQTTVYTVSRGVDVGHLNISMIDSHDGSIVWKADAQKGLQTHDDTTTRLKRLQSIIGKMFETFPPRG